LSSGNVGYIVLAGIIITFLTAVIGLWQTSRKLTRLEVSVDGNLTRILNKLGDEQMRTAQLRGTLSGAGVDIPPREIREDESGTNGS
jgi:hypothetical protein